LQKQLTKKRSGLNLTGKNPMMMKSKKFIIAKKKKSQLKKLGSIFKNKIIIASEIKNHL
jgi:hypothetical protein